MPTLPETGFYWKIYPTATLRVPEGMEAQYQGADGWKNFNNIVGDTFEGITPLPTSQPDNLTTTLYDLSGRRVSPEHQSNGARTTTRGILVGNGIKVIK